MKPESEEPRNPAVIVLGELNGLGVSRGLGRGGVKSCVFDRNRLAPAMWSRHTILVLADRLDGEPLLGQLPLLQSTFGFRPVLYNTHELAVCTIAEHRHRLDDAFHFFLPAEETVLDLRDKGRFKLPDAFAFLPQGQRAETALKALGSSGAWWLKDRMEDLIPLLMFRDIMGYSVVSTRARLRVRAGFREAELEADHVIAATGHKPDVARRPFLDPALLAAIERHAGFPTLNRTYASAVPGRHFLEMRNAGTLGPVMRFVFGGKHSGPAIAQATAADHRHRTVRRSPRGTETPCWRQARGRRRDGGGPVPRTAVPAKAQHPRETRPSV